MSWCCLTVLCRFLSPQKVCVGVGVYQVLARGELAPVVATLNCGDFNHYLERAIHHSVVCSLAACVLACDNTDWLTDADEDNKWCRWRGSVPASWAGHHQHQLQMSWMWYWWVPLPSHLHHQPGVRSHHHHHHHQHHHHVRWYRHITRTARRAGLVLITEVSTTITFSTDHLVVMLNVEL